MSLEDRLVTQCQRELVNLFPEIQDEHVMCPEFLDMYWSGEELGPDDSRYLYNICPKRVDLLYEAVLTGKLSAECQARYVDTVIQKLGLLFGFKKGKLVGNAITPFLNLYLPPILIYAIFTLDEPVYLTRMDLSWNRELLVSLLDIWQEQGIIRPSPFHSVGYFYLKFSLKKYLPSYCQLTKSDDVIELRRQLARQDLEKFFIQGIRKSVQSASSRVPMSLLEIFVIGFMFRVLTRSRKIKSFLSENSLKRLIWTFSFRTGIEDTVYLEELYTLLFDISCSEFIRDVVNGKLTRFSRNEVVSQT
jgi:hypothetical protein